MNGSPANATDETDEVPNDDDDDGGPEGPSGYATSSQKDQISTRDDPLSEGEGFRDRPSNSGEDPQPGPRGQQN